MQYLSMARMRRANLVVLCLQCHHQGLGLLLPGLLQRCRLAQVCFSIWRHQWKTGLSPHFIVPQQMKCPMEKWTKCTFWRLFLRNLFLWLSLLFVCAFHISYTFFCDRLLYVTDVARPFCSAVVFCSYPVEDGVLRCT